MVDVFVSWKMLSRNGAITLEGYGYFFMPSLKKVHIEEMAALAREQAFEKQPDLNPKDFSDLIIISMLEIEPDGP